MIGLLVLAMNYNHPFSSEGRFFFVTTPITPTVGGRVIEVPVAPNTPLKAGDVLFRIDPERYKNAVKAKEAELADAVQAEKQLQSAAEMAKKNSDAAASSRDGAKDLYDRSKPLVDKGVISQAQFKEDLSKYQIVPGSVQRGHLHRPHEAPLRSPEGPAPHEILDELHLQRRALSQGRPS